MYFSKLIIKKFVLFALATILPFPLIDAAQANSHGLNCKASKADLITTKFGEDRAYFRDWLGACRQDGYCSANIYVASSDNPIAYHVRIGRAHFGMDYELKFVMAEHMLAPNSPLALAVDGKKLAKLEAGDDMGWYLEDNVANEYVVGTSRANLELIPALIAGSRLHLEWQDQQGQPSQQSYSLIGLTRALCWLDKKQKPN
ncbi:MAG TPA: hypothetical protein DCS30_07920 [Rhizobiales bacterium]|nr:hypothetical protein [Hyphomicrobiales bacterium]